MANFDNTILDVLEIKEEALPEGTEKAVRFINSEWNAQGHPVWTNDLERFLDWVIDECKVRELWYPAVFLKRLAQLKRREWEPDWTIWSKSHRAGRLRSAYWRKVDREAAR